MLWFPALHRQLVARSRLDSRCELHARGDRNIELPFAPSANLKVGRTPTLQRKTARIFRRPALCYRKFANHSLPQTNCPLAPVAPPHLLLVALDPSAGPHHQKPDSSETRYRK